MTGEAEICAVVCTRNRSRSLAAALASLARQKSPYRWKAVVVDNGSTDDTQRVVREAAGGFPVPLDCLQEPRPGTSAARNHALSVCRAEFALFLDDDAVCLPGWLEAHGAALMDPAVAATGGRILPVFPAGISPFMRELLLSENGGPAAHYDLGSEPIRIEEGSSFPLPFGANMGFRRAEALAAGGFRTELSWGGGDRWILGEETELLGRLRGRGGQVVYVPGATVEHHVGPEKTTFGYWEEYQAAYGRYLETTAPGRTRFHDLFRGLKYAWNVFRYSVLLRVRADGRLGWSRKRARDLGRLDVLISRRFRRALKGVRHEPP